MYAAVTYKLHFGRNGSFAYLSRERPGAKEPEVAQPLVAVAVAAVERSSLIWFNATDLDLLPENGRIAHSLEIMEVLAESNEQLLEAFAGSL